jgi:hypothetical protein
MAQCPVQDCERRVGFGSKALAGDAAVLAAFFAVFDRAEELWPDQFPEEFSVFVNAGRGFFRLVHERAHGNHVEVPTRLIRDWRKAAEEACEGVAIRDPEWFREYWTGAENRGLQVPEAIHWITRGVKSSTQFGQDLPAWRDEGEHVFSLLAAYADSVEAFYNATDPSSNFVRSNAATTFSALTPAHDQFHAALNVWIKKNAPGARNTGRKDPTGGGFGALSKSLRDAYRAVVLAHLTLLGLTIYNTQVKADGRADEVTEAYDLAVRWYDDAMKAAHSIIATGEPVGTKFMATYFDQVSRKHEAAENAYKRLQPYLDGFAPNVSGA